MTEVTKKSGRIEYLDAMRGFTMLLVVFSHILVYCFQFTDPHSFNIFFKTFRMPLFFFLSGFIMKNDLPWDVARALKFLWTKFKVQVLATFIFLVVYCLVFRFDLVSILHMADKGGYWFTLTLFQFFIVYIVLRLALNRLNILVAEAVIAVLSVALALFAVKSGNLSSELLGTEHLKFFMFFFFGTLVKRHFPAFCRLTDRRWVVCSLVVLWGVLFYAFVNTGAHLFHLMIGVCLGVVGITAVFTLFRINERIFAKERKLGRAMQYIGRRTLDIYFLHFFFLPRGLSFVGDTLKGLGNPVLEFLLAMSCAIVVVAVCLLVSRVICLSDNLGHILFGKKLAKP